MFGWRKDNLVFSFVCFTKKRIYINRDPLIHRINIVLNNQEEGEGGGEGETNEHMHYHFFHLYIQTVVSIKNNKKK